MFNRARRLINSPDKEWGSPKPYVPMLFMPRFLARRTYLGYPGGITVGPPACRHRPYYPRYQDLEPGTGVAVPKSPRFRVYSFIWLEVVLVVACLNALISGQGGMTQLWLGLAVANLAVTWYAYLRWASLVTVVTPDAIYRYRGVYAAAPEMLQGADIDKVEVIYRSPWKFWRWLGYGRVLVYSGPDKATVWELRGIGNAEGLGSLIQGLQASLETSAKELPVLMREMIGILYEIRDMMCRHWEPAPSLAEYPQLPPQGTDEEVFTEEVFTPAPKVSWSGDPLEDMGEDQPIVADPLNPSEAGDPDREDTLSDLYLGPDPFAHLS